MVVKINGCEAQFEGVEPISVVEFVKMNGQDVPTLCFLKDCGNVAKCGLCSVLVNGKKTLACKTEVQDGDEIVTPFVSDENGKNIVNENAPELAEFLQKRIAKMLESHDFSCGKCSRMKNCEFLKLVQLTKAKAEVKYDPSDDERESRWDKRSKGIWIDRNRCVGCSRCAATCAFKTTTESVAFGKLPDGVAESTGLKRGVCPAIGAEASELPFDQTKCLLCGQCVVSCPVNALTDEDNIPQVLEALDDPSKHVIVAIAPSVRASLGESFGFAPGTDVTGKIYTALRLIGFDKVFDINFSADQTILEEGTELLQRLGLIEGGHSTKLPMLTSCCPGWMRLASGFFPELKENISTCKSPQQMFGAAAKAYYPNVAGVKAEDVFVVSVMPCVAKKYEAVRDDNMFGASGDPKNPDIDAVLTVRELAELIKQTKGADSKRLNFAELEDSEADPEMGEYTGAGTIFGVTGGVMEAAVRTAADLVSARDLEDVNYTSLRGFCGVREATIPLAQPDGSTVDLKVAVVNGAANFFKFRQEGNFDDYHFIEVMACPGGCVGGGGQPHVNAKDQLELAEDAEGNCAISGHNAGTGEFLPKYIAARASVLRAQDQNGNFTNKKRKSHENAALQKMYETLGVKPGEGIAHKLFHC